VGATIVCQYRRTRFLLCKTEQSCWFDLITKLNRNAACSLTLSDNHSHIKTKYVRCASVCYRLVFWHIWSCWKLNFWPTVLWNVISLYLSQAQHYWQRFSKKFMDALHSKDNCGNITDGRTDARTTQRRTDGRRKNITLFWDRTTWRRHTPELAWYRNRNQDQPKPATCCWYT